MAQTPADAAHDAAGAAPAPAPTDRATDRAAAARPRLAGRQYFPCLDGVRALAMFAVAGSHIGFVTGAAQRAGYGRWLTHLDVGPPQFFLLSAFLLYRPYAKARLEERRGVPPKEFLCRRALRVLPAYWLALVVLDATGVITIHGWRQWLSFGTLTNIYVPHLAFQGIFQVWSLAVEVSFYFFVMLYVPVIARWTRGLSAGESVRREVAVLAGLIVLSNVYRAILEPFSAHSQLAQAMTYWLPGQLDHFAYGMLLALLSVWAYSRAEPGAWLRRVERFGTGWFVVAALIFVLIVRVLPYHPGFVAVTGYEGMLKHFLEGLFILCFSIPAVFGDPRQGVYRRFLSLRPLLFVGLTSYGFFLYHAAFIDPAMRWLGVPEFGGSLRDFLLVFAIVCALAIPCGAASWYLVEKPVQQLRNRVRARRALAS